MIAQADKDTDRAAGRNIADMPAEVYHADPAQGSSMLETFRDDRREYQHRYVVPVELRLPPKEPTAAMNLGTLTHLWLFEPDKFKAMVAPPYPEKARDGKKWYRRKGSDHDLWWQEEVAKRKGLIPCDKPMLDQVAGMTKAIREHPKFKPLLDSGGTCEHSLFWFDRETGLECKLRADWITAGPHPIAIDLKTTACVAPSAYSRQCVSMGYHRKLAHYCDGLLEHYGERIPLVHIAVESEWPFRVAFYDLDDLRDGVRLGESQRRKTLRDLSQCLATDDWREEWEKQITKLRMPAWAWTENDYQMESSDGDSDN